MEKIIKVPNKVVILDEGEAAVICDALFRDYIHCIVKHTDTNRCVPIAYKLLRLRLRNLSSDSSVFRNKLIETCRTRQEWFPFRDDK